MKRRSLLQAGLLMAGDASAAHLTRSDPAYLALLYWQGGAMTNLYPLPRSVRQTEILLGNGGCIYGPFDGLKIFDIEDVEVWVRPVGDASFSKADVTIAKVDNLPFDFFTVDFGETIPVTTEYLVRSARVANRDAGVDKGTQLNMTALEKELSKIASVQQELRRDVGRALSPIPGDAGQILPTPDGISLLGWGSDNKLINRPGEGQSAANAQAYAMAAQAAANSNYDFATFGDIGMANIPLVVQFVRTAGYAAQNDGLGNTYVRTPGDNAFRESIEDAFGNTWYEAGDILRPLTVSIPTHFATLNDLWEYLKPRRIRAKLSVAIPAATIPHSALWVPDHPDQLNVELTGVMEDITIASVGAATGSAWQWNVPLPLVDASNVAVGDWIYIQAKITSAAGEGSNIEGCWRVLSVAGGTVTVRVTSQTAAFPAIADVNIPAKVIKSTCQWDSETSGGIFIAGGPLGRAEGIVFDGQFDVATGEGSDVAGNGLFVGGFSHLILGLDLDFMPQLGSGTFYYCAFNRWKADGIIVHGGVVDASFTHQCSNGWRGRQSGGGGSYIFGKSGVSSGNRKSGDECESTGGLNINNSVQAGNGEAGIYAPFDGGIMATNCRMLRNVGAGADLRYGSRANFTGSLAKDNTVNGIFVNGAKCRVDGVTCSGHSDGDLRAQGYGVVIAEVAPTLLSAVPYRTTTTSPGVFLIAGVNGVITNGLFFNATTGANGGGAIVPVSSGQIAFQTRASGAASAVTTFTMTAAALAPASDNSRDVGVATTGRIRDIFLVNSPTVTSDADYKEQIGPIPDTWLDAWADVQWIRYKWKAAVAAKGEAARWHIGLIAQQVQDAFAAHGIDAFAIGLLCYDEWDSADAVLSYDDDGSPQVILEAKEAGSRYAIRYAEAEAMEAAYQRRRADRMEARIAALESS